MHRHTISVLVENKFGVLARVAGMFSGRGFNIHSLNVGPSHDPSVSRMTLVVNAKDDKVVDQIIKQLDKLVDVIEIIDFREGESVERELVLLQVNVNSKTRAEVIEMCTIFRGKIIDVAPTALTIEITGDGGKVEKFIQLMSTFNIHSLTRTGKIALPVAKGLDRKIIST
jgi:acetolactate synthase-1/3 small subunit